MIFFRKKLKGYDEVPPCIRKVYRVVGEEIRSSDFPSAFYGGYVQFMLWKVFMGEDDELTWMALPPGFVKKYLSLGETVLRVDQDDIVAHAGISHMFNFGLGRADKIVIRVRRVGVKAYPDRVGEIIAGLRKHGLDYINKYFEADLSPEELKEYFEPYLKYIASGTGETQLQALAEMLLRLIKMHVLDKHMHKVYGDTLRLLTAYRTGYILEIEIDAPRMEYVTGYKWEYDSRQHLNVLCAKLKRVGKVKLYVLRLKQFAGVDDLKRYVYEVFLREEMTYSFLYSFFNAVYMTYNVYPVYVLDRYRTVFLGDIYVRAEELGSIIYRYFSVCQWEELGCTVHGEGDEVMHSIICAGRPLGAPPEQYFLLVAFTLPMLSNKDYDIKSKLYYGFMDVYGSENRELIHSIIDKRYTFFEAVHWRKFFNVWDKVSVDEIASSGAGFDVLFSGVNGVPRYEVLASKIGLRTPYRAEDREKQGVRPAVPAPGEEEGEKPENMSDKLEKTLRELGLM